eukprot:symbB.v1.2.038801.t1/scaffold6180.1/size20265/1
MLTIITLPCMDCNMLVAAGKHQNPNVTDPRQCALQFVDVAEELIKKRLTDKYDSFVVTEGASSASSAKPGAKGRPQELVPRTFDENGQIPWHQVLKELGYEVSSHVERKKDKTTACIEKIIDDKVILVVDESVMAGGKCQVSASSFTSGEWKVVKEPKAPELAKVILPQDFKELRHMYAKGALIKQLLDMEKKDEVSKMVVSNASFKANKAVLIPITNKIEVIDKEDDHSKINPSAVHVDGKHVLPKGEFDHLDFYLMSPNLKDCTCPYFMAVLMGLGSQLELHTEAEPMLIRAVSDTARVMESGDEASGAEPEDGEMIMEKQVVIKLPGCKKKWAPEYKEIGDRVFIKVCKWDREQQEGMKEEEVVKEEGEEANNWELGMEDDGDGGGYGDGMVMDEGMVMEEEVMAVMVAEEEVMEGMMMEEEVMEEGMMMEEEEMEEGMMMEEGMVMVAVGGTMKKMKRMEKAAKPRTAKPILAVLAENTLVSLLMHCINLHVTIASLQFMPIDIIQNMQCQCSTC